VDFWDRIQSEKILGVVRLTKGGSREEWEKKRGARLKGELQTFVSGGKVL